MKRERDAARLERWQTREPDTPAQPRVNDNLPEGRRLLQSSSYERPAWDRRSDRRRAASPPPGAPAARANPRGRSRDPPRSAIDVTTPPRNARSASPTYSPSSPSRALSSSFLASLPAAPAEPECEVLARQLLRTIADLNSLTITPKHQQPLLWSDLATKSIALLPANRIVSTFRDVLHTSHEFFGVKAPVAHYFDSPHLRCSDSPHL